MIQLDVSRETLDQLKAYEALVLKWTKKINLISKSSADDLWTRHILDSAQLMPFVPDTARHLLDLGSGGGFPSLVLSIMAQERRPGFKVSCVESDARKCTFLRTVVRELSLPVTVYNERVEDLSPQGADVITARAFTALNGLLEFADRHRHQDSICLFLKGRTTDSELAEARRTWHFEVERFASATSPQSWVLKVGEFSRV